MSDYYTYYDVFFFFNDTATTEIYTLSLHDALPILAGLDEQDVGPDLQGEQLDLLVGERHGRGDHLALLEQEAHDVGRDRKSTRLNSSHANISYAVFCLKKKKKYMKLTLPILLITQS